MLTLRTEQVECVLPLEYAGKEFQVTVKPFTAAKAKEIGEKCMITKKGKTDKKDKVITDWLKFREERFCGQVVDWSGIGAKGKSLVCSEENKKALCEYNSEFVEFILNEISNLDEYRNREKEKSKND